MQPREMFVCAASANVRKGFFVSNDFCCSVAIAKLFVYLLLKAIKPVG